MSLLDRSLLPFSSITIHWRRHVLDPCTKQASTNANASRVRSCALELQLCQSGQERSAEAALPGDAVAGGMLLCCAALEPGLLRVVAGCRSCSG